MLIKGEKWACEACVRGHRVSNCQHSDRPLQHINKKGRPVSQCQHCRTLRKSRSAHVRCDCGEKAHQPKGACGHDNEPQENNCGCCHGQRCTCSVKKEHLDPVPESDSDDTPAFSIPVNEKRPRARALTVQSEGSGLTVFTNGHHKPVHKHNNAAHKCGLPYVVPRAHTVHGPLASSLANRSVDSLPHTSTIDTLHSTSHIRDSMVSAQQEQRMIKSEHGSPVLASGTNMDDFGTGLAPLDMSTINGDYGFLGNFDGLSGIPEMDQPLFSAGLSAASIDWSHYDGLDFNNDTFTNPAYSQAASFTGFDFGTNEHPALTATSTSGEISEVEDLVTRSDNVVRPALQQRRYDSEFEASDIGDGYRLSTASSYIGLPQAQMLSSSNINNVDIDAFMNASQTKFSSANEVADCTSFNDDSNTKNLFDDSTNFPCLTTDDDNDAFWMSGFTSGQMNNGRNELHDSNNWLQ